MAKKDTVADEFEDSFEEGGSMSEESGAGMIDLSGVSDEGGFTPVPRGIYPVSLDELNYGQSQSSGNNMWTWIFEIESGEFKGRKFFYHTTFTEGGLPRVKRALARIKTEDGYEATLLNSQFNPEAVALSGKLIGARARLDIRIKPYEGKPSNNVKDILPPEDGAGGDGFGGL